MKGRQMAMDAVLEEYDSFREKREIREPIATWWMKEWGMETCG